MKTVKEVSKITGVTVRTLRHYDSIGLLRPAAYTDSGYRLYDDECLKKLQCILFFRELDFPLKKIKEIIDEPSFNIESALEKQIKMLEARKKRTENLILLAKRILEKGDNVMDFSQFDRSKSAEYEKEAEERWGNTEAYSQSSVKRQSRTDGENEAAANAMMRIFARFGEIKDCSPDSPQAQSLVKQLRDFITDNYYECTDEILAGLGMMYEQDERFSASIDSAGGKGTAFFTAKAIEIFTKK